MGMTKDETTTDISGVTFNSGIPIHHDRAMAPVESFAGTQIGWRCDCGFVLPKACQCEMCGGMLTEFYMHKQRVLCGRCRGLHPCLNPACSELAQRGSKYHSVACRSLALETAQRKREAERAAYLAKLAESGLVPCDHCEAMDAVTVVKAQEKCPTCGRLFGRCDRVGDSAKTVTRQVRAHARACWKRAMDALKAHAEDPVTAPPEAPAAPSAAMQGPDWSENALEGPHEIRELEVDDDDRVAADLAKDPSRRVRVAWTGGRLRAWTEATMIGLWDLQATAWYNAEKKPEHPDFHELPKARKDEIIARVKRVLSGEVARAYCSPGDLVVLEGRIRTIPRLSDLRDDVSAELAADGGGGARWHHLFDSVVFGREHPTSTCERLFGNANIGNIAWSNMQVPGQLACDTRFWGRAWYVTLENFRDREDLALRLLHSARVWATHRDARGQGQTAWSLFVEPHPLTLDLEVRDNFGAEVSFDYHGVQREVDAWARTIDHEYDRPRLIVHYEGWLKAPVW